MEKDGKRKRRTFSAEYKAETVRLVQRSGKSIGQIALELGIGETALVTCPNRLSTSRFQHLKFCESLTEVFLRM